MKKRFGFKLSCLLLAIVMLMPLLSGFAAMADEQEAPQPEPQAVEGVIGNVRLISWDVMEIEFSAPVLNNADAQTTFTILIDDVAVQWDYLSYFAFGTHDIGYAAKPVVNIRLREALDTG